MIYLNDRLVPPEKALVSVYDHGFLYGDGIYETLRAYGGTVFMLDAHIDRLFASASMIGLTLSKDGNEIKKAVYDTVRANGLDDANIRITVSRGPGPTGLDPELCPEPTFVIMAKEFTGYPARYFRNGVEVAVVNRRRNYKRAIDPAIKSLNFLNNILAKVEAKKRGAYEAIMLNYRGELTEGTISNLFFVKDGILCTPSMSSGILGGITRRIILELAKSHNVETNEGRFRLKDLYGADEVFISNTTMEIMPVSKVDDRTIPDGPGALTRELRKAYRKRVSHILKKERE